MIPAVGFVVEMPEAIAEGRARINATHNTAVKEAGRRTLIWHQTNQLGAHFEADNKSRYRHHQRSQNTIRRQKRTGKWDLHKSGRTETRMTRRPPKALRAGGTATGGRVSFTMTFAFPFPIGKNKSGITLSDMAQEIEQITPSEQRQLSLKFREFYVQEMLERLKPRQRKRFAARLSELGIQ